MLWLLMLEGVLHSHLRSVCFVHQAGVAWTRHRYARIYLRARGYLWAGPYSVCVH